MSAQLQTAKAQQTDKPKKSPFIPYRGPRDTLTGAPVDRRGGAIVRLVNSEYRLDVRPTRAQRTEGWRAGPEDVTARPLRIHRHESETTTAADGPAPLDGKGALGGPLYARDMQRHLDSAVSQQQAEARANLWVWHRSAYGRGRAHAALVARYGPRQGEIAYRAALAFASDSHTVKQIAAWAQRTPQWVARMARIARESARPLNERARAAAAGSAPSHATDTGQDHDN